MKDDLTPEMRAILSKTNAMDQVKSAANAAWKVLILDIIWAVACEIEFLTTDEVCIRYRSLPDEARHNTHNWKALGAQMKTAARLGYIIKTPHFRPSTDGARRHHAPLQIWRSLVFNRKHPNEK